MADCHRISLIKWICAYFNKSFDGANLLTIDEMQPMVFVFQLKNITLPDHWMKQIFMAHSYIELQLYEEALKMYEALRENGLMKSSYVKAQIGLAYYNLRGNNRRTIFLVC